MIRYIKRAAATRGAMKMARFHTSLSSPAFWKGNTKRTEAAIKRVELTGSSSFQDRFSIVGRYSAFGQAR